VAASTHTWDELSGHLQPTPEAALAAHERVLRGEDLSADDRVDRRVLELPLVLQRWEPAYPLAAYKAHEADFGGPPEVDAWREFAAEPAPVVEDPEARRALLDLAGAWVTESNGRAEAVAVEGDATGALAALGVHRGRIATVDAADGLAAMAWTGASGGGHGRRRGMATGRFAAWWALAALAGLLDEWPVPPDEMGTAAARLRWYRWDSGEPETGWSLRLAVEDPDRGRAWALSAVDAA
jgi:resuscitation-promoting factor RpfA